MGSRADNRWWESTLLVLASQMALAVLIYRHSLRLAFVSDAWVYLDSLRNGVWATLTTPIGYHFQPVAAAWVALIRACFGENATAFQAVLVAQIVCLGYLTYALGRRLLENGGAAFLASLLVIGNPAFFEISYWPLAGNMSFLAAQFYVLALIIACDLARGRLGVRGPWWLGLMALAAIFTHPAMTTVLPVCAIAVLLIGNESESGHISGPTRTLMVRALLALGVAGAVFALSRLAFAEAAAGGPKPGLDVARLYWTVSNGLVAVFTLRGSHDLVHRLMTFGTNAAYPSIQLSLYVFGWLALAAAAGTFAFVRARNAGIRVLICFLGLQLAALAVAGGGVTSRESHLPAVPAALLTLAVLSWAADRLAALAATAAGADACRRIPAMAVLLLLVSAEADHITANEAAMKASNLSRLLVERVEELAPPGRGAVNITLVNMPANMVARGIIVWAFSNGLTEQIRLASPEGSKLEMRLLSIPGAPTDVANGSTPVTVTELHTQLLDPNRIVVLYEAEPFGLRTVTLDSVESLASPRQDPAGSAPRR